jgi:hypothetical protein
MKRLLLALLFVPLVATAEEWLETSNAAGGKILLLQNKCRGGKEGKMVISTTPSGPNIHGCWYYFAEMIHIAWESGNTSSFTQEDFVYKKSKP